jgi:hypothetical protein
MTNLPNWSGFLGRKVLSESLTSSAIDACLDLGLTLKAVTEREHELGIMQGELRCIGVVIEPDYCANGFFRRREMLLAVLVPRLS